MRIRLKTKANLHFATVFMVGILLAINALAIEKLRFNHGLSTISKALIHQHLGHDTAENFDIAQADLNGDGLYEFIIKQKTCTAPDKNCDIFVLARRDTTMIELLRVQARHVALDRDYHKGVRSLLAFKDAYNDFKYDVYVWEAKQSRYILSQ